MSQLNHSPKSHLVGAGKVYPDIWRKIDEIRASATWPAWCFAPMSEIFRCIHADWVGRSDIHNMTADVARLASLVAWRATQGIYQFDPDLYAALVTTPVDRLPAEVLTLLPEWGVYIETPDNDQFIGFFAHCDYDPRNKSPELRLLLDTEDNLIPVAIPIINGMLSDAIDIAMPGFGSQLAITCQPLVSLVLYICSVSADFGHYSAYRRLPTKTKKACASSLQTSRQLSIQAVKLGPYCAPVAFTITHPSWMVRPEEHCFLTSGGRTGTATGWENLNDSKFAGCLRYLLKQIHLQSTSGR